MKRLEPHFPGHQSLLISEASQPTTTLGRSILGATRVSGSWEHPGGGQMNQKKLGSRQEPGQPVYPQAGGQGTGPSYLRLRASAGAILTSQKRP